MKFLNVIKDINNKNARHKGLKAYYSSGQVYFSRLFGFERINNSYVPIPKYASVIKYIFRLLNEGATLPEIKQKLDSEGFKDASNNRYSIDRICSLVRPIYSGYIKQGFSYCRVNNIEPIVDFEVYNTAKTRLVSELKKLRKI